MNRKFHPFVVLVTVLAFSIHPVGAQKLLADGIRDLSDQISQSAIREKKQRIAVLPLRELYGQPTALGAYLSEEMTTLLVQAGKFQVVERSQLDRILTELKLDRSGLIDKETAKKVGKLAGADAILTGTISDLATFVAVNCRMIDGLTGEVQGAAQVKIAKDADVTKIMAIPVSSEGPDSQSATLTSGSPQPSPKKELRQETLGISFVLKGCNATGNVVDCDLIIMSLDSDSILELNESGSRMFDTEGNEIKGSKALLGTSSGSKGLIAGVAIKGRLTFSGVPLRTSLASVIEIVGRTIPYDRDVKLQFRNVPIQRP